MLASAVKTATARPSACGGIHANAPQPLIVILWWAKGAHRRLYLLPDLQDDSLSEVMFLENFTYHSIYFKKRYLPSIYITRRMIFLRVLEILEESLYKKFANFQLNASFFSPRNAFRCREGPIVATLPCLLLLHHT
jgi:hypothetical protein